MTPSLFILGIHLEMVYYCDCVVMHDLGLYRNGKYGDAAVVYDVGIYYYQPNKFLQLYINMWVTGYLFGIISVVPGVDIRSGRDAHHYPIDVGAHV